MKKLLPLAIFSIALSIISPIQAQAIGPYSHSEINFAEMMIPHHRQAVLISTWALTQGSNAATKKLAAKIISEQSPEIKQMTSWLSKGGAMDGSMAMDGYLNDSDLATLKSARGKKFDGLYLVDMTLHHQGAIAMATPLLKSKNREVASLCKAIIKGQSAEINEMRRIMMTGK